MTSKRVTSPKDNGKDAEAHQAAMQQQVAGKMTYHLIPSPVLQDLLNILKALPYDDVYRIMPNLITSETIQKDQ